MEFTPKLAEWFLEHAKDWGLALPLLIMITVYVWEVRRGIAKDKAIAKKESENRAIQMKMLEAIGTVNTAVSNGNLLLDLLVRGRK